MLGATDLLGRWQIRRQIDDRFAKQRGVYHGTAVFRDGAAGQLCYVEGGKIRFGVGPVLRATREYRWHFLPDKVAVLFDDGRLLHHFVPAEQCDSSAHLCGSDLYKAIYDFRHWPLWEAVWQVSGPRKNYTLTSHFSK